MKTDHKIKLVFRPKELVNRLVSFLPKRAQDIVHKRYGLSQPEPMTLEAIGGFYGITRERVRQIEDATLRQIKKSPNFAALAGEFIALKQSLADNGALVHESDFLSAIDPEPINQNHAHFIMVVGDDFVKLKEDDIFHHRWTVDEALADRVQQSLRRLAAELTVDDLLTEEEMANRLWRHWTALATAPNDNDGERARDHARRWLRVSKEIGLSPVGEWGLSRSPNVRVRGIRDYAFLTLRRHGSPLHFTEVARSIEQLFKQPANPATCHNELIKDLRFVLVGRGLYALAEWGYSRGVVRDVIKTLLEKHGPMTEEEIIARTLKERYVKENTILVNLRNPQFFRRDRIGKFKAL